MLGIPPVRSLTNDQRGIHYAPKLQETCLLQVSLSTKQNKTKKLTDKFSQDRELFAVVGRNPADMGPPETCFAEVNEEVERSSVFFKLFSWRFNGHSTGASSPFLPRTGRFVLLVVL